MPRGKHCRKNPLTVKITKKISRIYKSGKRKILEVKKCCKKICEFRNISEYPKKLAGKNHQVGKIPGNNSWKLWEKCWISERKNPVVFPIIRKKILKFLRKFLSIQNTRNNFSKFKTTGEKNELGKCQGNNLPKKPLTRKIVAKISRVYEYDTGKILGIRKFWEKTSRKNSPILKIPVNNSWKF